MEKYENLGLVGEGSYGLVMKCKNKSNGRIVAIKKFLESEEDKMVKKIAMREIKLLKQLRHDNLVNLLEVCKKKRRWYLVFEFVERTVLDDLEQFPNGMENSKVKKYLFQILRAVAFCHSHNIIHRDIKPENILVSQNGVVKLCDFGFARTMAAPGELYTDYVATRWYRAPELVVGDTKYGKAVDVWAIGCLVVEMLTGEPLFPGDSDIDQLYHIIKCLGNLTPRHQELFHRNPVFAGVRLPEIQQVEPLEKTFPKLHSITLSLVKKCLHIDPDKRSSCSELLRHEYFTRDGFAERFIEELNYKLKKNLKESAPLSKKSKTSKRDKEERTADESKTISKEPSNLVKIIENKSDAKTMKTRETLAETEKVEMQTIMEGNEGPEKSIEKGVAMSRAVQLCLRDQNTCNDSSVGSAIPPISQTPASSSLNVPSAAVSGSLSYRGNEKTTKHITVFKKHCQQPLPGHYNISLMMQAAHDKSALHDRSVPPDRTGNGSKKKWEFGKSDVHLPELSSSHLPELKGPEGRLSKAIKKESKKTADCRIPSLAALDVHSSMALQQMSGTSYNEATEANLPRVDH
ncbi:cyclin-dependent kinase-like 2 [Polypterus senegalus]|uniref:cyclin-dependent kinase-like 2 n=1 Tax=Polypterus senegalus TaxID=55291 RepID=UPI0019639F7C|nr:cyclin-dependent kinase-like 2 [Polypterus senegalus]XP_039606078.1 cyclin-dependent kinase-like 2 [Polypterus senegalus]XP_039606079.1 cyclin-dependent kinase-like 2 [Polypterus senegalus]